MLRNRQREGATSVAYMNGVQCLTCAADAGTGCIALGSSIGFLATEAAASCCALLCCSCCCLCCSSSCIFLLSSSTFRLSASACRRCSSFKRFSSCTRSSKTREETDTEIYELIRAYKACLLLHTIELKWQNRICFLSAKTKKDRQHRICIPQKFVQDDRQHRILDSFLASLCFVCMICAV